MSDYESHSGKIIPVKRLENESNYDYFFRVTETSLSDDHLEDIHNALYDFDLHDKYFFIKETIYKNVDHKELDPYADIQEIEGNEVDGYTYFMKFYNGGTCLSEMIEDSLSNL